VAILGAVLMAVMIARYSPPAELSFDPRLLLAFDPAKVSPVLRALALLVAFNLAA
jgi:hypothetical protein